MRTTDSLKDELREKRETMQENHKVRLHRALSWLRAAEEHAKNEDLSFVCLWIAFNSCYGIDDSEVRILTERDQFRDFLNKLVSHDQGKKIYNCLWSQFSGPVKALIKNPYLFKPFWDAQNEGGDKSIWNHRFEKSSAAAMNYLSRQDVPGLMGVVLDRLYILRNQIMHGGATYQSQVNRSQITDGRNMLLVLMPIIIEIMMDSEGEDWGEIYYPVIQQE